MADAPLLSSPSLSPSELSSMLQGSLQLHQFFLNPDERPQVAYDQFQEEDELPVIDLGIIRSESYDDKTDCLRKLVRACKEWGFFRLVNHGLPVELIREMDTKARKVFNLPSQAKLQIHDPEETGYGYNSGSQDGYNFQGYWHEALRFQGDSKIRKDFVETTIPPDVDNFGVTLEEYMDSMEKLAKEVATHLAVALGLPSGSFSDACKGLLMRFNHYPACPQPLSTLGLLSHLDGFVLTIIHEDHVGGLQILKQLKQQQQEDEWISVRPQFGSFIVNVGDILQVHTTHSNIELIFYLFLGFFGAMR
ncbi:hypothetical protein O6H91_06G069800 [Diphasiastrum complanatum]|uniref:Uncharacterized protein n=1 Tax=Diphasiastrum complanatum TaxID=34168 RepID=A0ACC2DET4_DIPCM|nr:hypothetical protein O6H91_06G069800 [Diphasiastrum complanatum]